MRYKLTRTLAVLLAATTLGLAGCGSQSAEDSGQWNDPGTSGAKISDGTLNPLLSAPADTQNAGGTAWLNRHGKTTVTISVTGLSPGKQYKAHVHAKSCAENAGDHFKFDQNGPAAPPNEIHLTVTPDAQGSGTATASVDQEAGSQARSVVVHDGEAKMLCADL